MSEDNGMHDENGEPGTLPEMPDEAPADPTSEAQLLRLLEAILFAAAEPLGERALQERLPEGADVPALLESLGSEYANRGVNLVQAGKTWAFRTAPDLGPLLTRQAEVVRRLSRAAVETLAIIAYHQPVTRAEIEEIRGVAISKGTLDNLLESGWIRPRGRRQTPGRPVTWGTTDAFLHHFDLETLDDLPGINELKAAGLLDAGPAIQSYRDTDVAAVRDTAESEDEEDAESEDPLDPDADEPDTDEPDTDEADTGAPETGDPNA